MYLPFVPTKLVLEDVFLCISKVTVIKSGIPKMSTQKIKPNPKKAELRNQVDEILAKLTPEDIEKQSNIIIKKILNHEKYKSAKRIALFLNLPNEVKTEPILTDILNRGKAPFIPQYSKGKMKMLRVMPGDMDIMVATSWGIKQHAANEDREDALDNGGLDLVIAPGAAFTREGWRCGHGGGYYDRYLGNLLKQHHDDPENFRKPYILAIGFSQQIFPEIPVDSQDIQVDEVVTGE